MQTIRSWHRSYFLYMLLGQLVIIFSLPYIHGRSSGAVIFDLLSTLLLSIGIYSLSEQRHAFWGGVALAVPTVISSVIASLHSDRNWTLALNYGTNLVFFAYITVMMIASMLKEQRISANTLFAGVSCYLLLAFTWANYYGLAQLLYTPAFVSQNVTYTGEFSDVLYFSLVTLSTAGYGDILPFAPPVRMSAGFEAIVGQLYLAILIARLVGLHITQRGELRGG